MWLSTREDRGTSEEDHTLEVKKFERLQTIFMMHELNAHEPAWKWNGELAGPSLTILHQMAVQSDLSDLQISLAKYKCPILIIPQNYNIQLFLDW